MPEEEETLPTSPSPEEEILAQLDQRKIFGASCVLGERLRQFLTPFKMMGLSDAEFWAAVQMVGEQSFAEALGIEIDHQHDHGSILDDPPPPTHREGQYL